MLKLGIKPKDPVWSCCSCCSFTQLCPTLWDPMDCSMPGFPVLHHPSDLAQTHVYWVSDAIQPSCLSSPSPAFNLTQHQGLFQWVGSSHQVAKGLELHSALVLPMNIQDWFPLGLTGLISLRFKGLLRDFSSTTVRKHQFFGAQPSLWSNSDICTWLLEKPQLWLYRPICRGQENCISPSSRMILWIREVGSQGQFHKEEETGELGFEEWEGGWWEEREIRYFKQRKLHRQRCGIWVCSSVELEQERGEREERGRVVGAERGREDRASWWERLQDKVWWGFLTVTWGLWLIKDHF